MLETDFFDLKNKVVVITGASGGVGSACAKLFAHSAGSHVVLLARKDCGALISEIEEGKGLVTFIKTDVSNRENLKNSFEEIRSTLGRVDVLLNVAGICEFYDPELSPLDKTSVDDARWERMMNVNGKAVANAIHFASKMMPAGSSIVNVSSTAGCNGAEMAVVDYSFSKAGILGLTMSYAKILGPMGIRVNAVAPGPIEGTDMLSQVKNFSVEDMKSKNKLGVLCQPIDIAKIMLFLASSMSRCMTGETVGASAGQFIGV